MKMKRQPREDFEASVIVKLANDPTTVVQDLVWQGRENVRFGSLAVDLDKINLGNSMLSQNIIQAPDFAFNGRGRKPAILEFAACVECAKV